MAHCSHAKNCASDLSMKNRNKGKDLEEGMQNLWGQLVSKIVGSTESRASTESNSSFCLNRKAILIVVDSLTITTNYFYL